LARLLAKAPISDPRVLLGPGVGLDCAVIESGDRLLILKSDPITFAADQIGWYAVQVNANDIATTGAVPRWMLATLLLPEGSATPESVEKLGEQLFLACQELGISLVGGHTEVTAGLTRPILIGTMIGEVDRDGLITPRGSRPGDHLCLTKGVPIEATALLAREFPERLQSVLSEAELRQAQNFLHTPGISILQDARIAVTAGLVTAMHDPTEGGLVAALWELAEASQCSLLVDLARVPVPPLSEKICQAFAIDPLTSIASGALLFTAHPDHILNILAALQAQGISCREIGQVREGPPVVWQTGKTSPEVLPRPERDAVARLFEGHSA
jgi:hydrogenase maturation factor